MASIASSEGDEPEPASRRLPLSRGNFEDVRTPFPTRGGRDDSSVYPDRQYPNERMQSYDGDAGNYAGHPTQFSSGREVSGESQLRRRKDPVETTFIRGEDMEYGLQKGSAGGDPLHSEKAVDGFGRREESFEGSDIVASSSIRRGARQYTKLEVMNAEQVRNVITFFLTFIAVGMSVSLITVAILNTQFRFTSPVGVNLRGLVRESDFREGLFLFVQENPFLFGGFNGEDFAVRQVWMDQEIHVDRERTFKMEFNSTLRTMEVSDGSATFMGKLREFFKGESPSNFADFMGLHMGKCGTPFRSYLSKRCLKECGGYKLCRGGNDEKLSAWDVMDVYHDFLEMRTSCLETTGHTVSCGVGEAVVRQAISPEEANAQYERAESLSGIGGDGGPLLAPDASDEELRVFANNLADDRIELGQGPDGPSPRVFIPFTFFSSGLDPDGSTARQFRDFILVINILMILAFVGGSIFAVIYIVRIARLGRSRITHEQIWVGMLIVLAALYWNLFDALVRIDRTVGRVDESFLPAGFQAVANVFHAIRDPAFSGITFFYVWASIHTYRILDPTQHLDFKNFYVPKFAIVIPYVLFKALAEPVLSLTLSEVPLVSIVAFVRGYSRFRVWNALSPQLLYTVAAVLMECGLIAIIAYEAATTARVLRRAKYMKYRTKQIGFRFFAYLNVIFFSALFVTQVAIILAVPPGEITFQIIVDRFTARLTDELYLGPSFMLLGYVLAEAYVKLPKDAVGLFKGWFVSSELAPSVSRWSSSGNISVSSQAGSISDDAAVRSRLMDHEHGIDSGLLGDETVASVAHKDGRLSKKSKDEYRATSAESLTSGGSWSHGTADYEGQGSKNHENALQLNVKGHDFQGVLMDRDEELELEIAEPVLYRVQEPREHLELRANCFTMQTHVIMFNFAWYVYYYGTPKEKNVRPSNDAFSFNVSKQVSEPDTDTHAIVIDGHDRIVVSFKGTTSLRNMQTSIQIYYEPLQMVIPLAESERNRLRQSRILRQYEHARVHKGFAIAYRSIAKTILEEVIRLTKERPRPVFLTGHSLGGALATLCSLDLWLTARLSRRQIFVSTFGAPRVGNEAFRRAYNRAVPLHWRIVLVSDIIAKLPKVGYKHVGKRVMLTQYGLLIIDPNPLETLHWSSKAPGFAYHRKASYMLAMRAWCIRHHGEDYLPEFWPFHVRAEDSRRFQEALEFGQEVTRQDILHARSRIIQLDAMVDSLRENDYDDDDEGQMKASHAVDLWARLARRALLSRTLADSGV